MSRMGLTYSQLILLFCISCASSFQSKFNSPPWKINKFQVKDCAEDHWKCPGENKCLSFSQLCDGFNDCQEGDDEYSDLCTKDFCWNELNRWKCPENSKVFKKQHHE